MAASPIKRAFKLVQTPIPGMTAGFGGMNEDYKLVPDPLSSHFFHNRETSKKIFDWVSDNIEPGNFVQFTALDLGNFTWQVHALHWTERTPE